MTEREKGRVKKSKKSASRSGSKGPTSSSKQKKPLAKASLVLDFSDPATVRAKLHGYDSVEEARADTGLFDFSSEYWQIEDDY